MAKVVEIGRNPATQALAIVEGSRQFEDLG